MADIIKIIGIAFILLCILFILYSIYILSKYKRITLDVRLPQPYRTVYRFFRDRPILGREVVRLRSDVTLLHNSDPYAKVFCAVVFTVFPFLFVAFFIVCALVCNLWYFTLVLGLSLCLISYLEFTNYIAKKARLYRYSSVSIYESAERRYANGDRTQDVFNQIASVSKGFMHTLSSNFSSKFGLSPDEAYSYFIDCIGDQFAEAFVRSIKAYDEEGKDPCKDILNTIKLARRRYYIERRTHAQVGGFKKLACIVAVITFACSRVADSMSYSLGGTPTLDWVTYLSFLVLLVCYILALFYERY